MKPADEIGSRRRNGSDVPSARSRYSQRSVRNRCVTTSVARYSATASGPSDAQRVQDRVPVHAVHGVDDADRPTTSDRTP